MTDDRLLIRLKYGVWNQWREENPGIVINLEGAALDGMVLTGIDFSDVSLRGASLHATNLMNADLRRADLTGANLAEAHLIGANLEGAILRGASLREADLLDVRDGSDRGRLQRRRRGLRCARSVGAAYFEGFDFPERLRATAWRTSALKAAASTSSPS